MFDLLSLKAKGRALRGAARRYRKPFRGYGPLLPQTKLKALQRVFLSGAPVIETGTHLGDSTRAFAALGHEVHTIEVSEELSAAIFPGLEALGISCYRGDSALVLPRIVDALLARGLNDVNFWLDGHFSQGITSRAQGYDTPVVAELEAIAARRARLARVVIAVDDVRYFGNDPGYPGKRFLVDWAGANGLEFYFLADIFLATTQRFADI